MKVLCLIILSVLSVNSHKYRMKDPKAAELLGENILKSVKALPSLPTRTEFMYSGKGINELGLYETCLAYANYTYFSVNYNDFIPQTALELGLCLPSDTNMSAF